MKTMIKIEGLNFYYGKEHALKNINTIFKKNEITGLIGASGSGKSSLLRCINRICENNTISKLTGEIIFNDQMLY